jgi:hypothetical protein
MKQPTAFIWAAFPFFVLLFSAQGESRKRDANQEPEMPPTPAHLVYRPPGDWTVWPLSDAEWTALRVKEGPLARFGYKGYPAGMVLVQCVKALQVLRFSRSGNSAAKSLRILTSHSTRDLDASMTFSTTKYLSAEVALTDPLLDNIASSDQRFAIDIIDLQPIVMPVSPALQGVISGCRKFARPARQ